jgi:ribosomal protein L40E
MDQPRCPSCLARVPADADWCSLCYTSLRATPAPAHVAYAPAADALTTAVPAAPAYPIGPDPLTAPLAQLAEQAPPVYATVGEPVQERLPTWPCRRCGALVPMESDACLDCGAGFLEGQADDIRLPLLGRATEFDSGKKAWIMVGGAVGIVAAFLVIAGILSLVF